MKRFTERQRFIGSIASEKRVHVRFGIISLAILVTAMASVITPRLAKSAPSYENCETYHSGASRVVVVSGLKARELEEATVDFLAKYPNSAEDFGQMRVYRSCGKLPLMMLPASLDQLVFIRFLDFLRFSSQERRVTGDYWVLGFSDLWDSTNKQIFADAVFVPMRRDDLVHVTYACEPEWKSCAGVIVRDGVWARSAIPTVEGRVDEYLQAIHFHSIGQR